VIAVLADGPTSGSPVLKCPVPFIRCCHRMRLRGHLRCLPGAVPILANGPLVGKPARRRRIPCGMLPASASSAFVQKSFSGHLSVSSCHLGQSLAKREPVGHSSAFSRSPFRVTRLLAATTLIETLRHNDQSAMVLLWCSPNSCERAACQAGLPGVGAFLAECCRLLPVRLSSRCPSQAIFPSAPVTLVSPLRDMSQSVTVPFSVGLPFGSPAY